ncbi:MAG: hypothetical protein KDB32_00365, partial [Planctomycetes bacterium]|nr:hypothetical protein [Planctomycetota bacterium]
GQNEGLPSWRYGYLRGCEPYVRTAKCAIRLPIPMERQFLPKVPPSLFRGIFFTSADPVWRRHRFMVIEVSIFEVRGACL